MDPLLEISKRGLLASRTAMDVIGNNIANADTPGYSRQRMDATPSPGYRHNGMTIGLGVTIQEIQRLHDTNLDSQIRDKQSEIGSKQEQQKIYQQIETHLSTQGGQDLDQLLGNFFNAFGNLSNRAEDQTLRNDVLNQTSALTTRFHELDAGLTSLKEDTADSVRQNLTQVNSILNDIANLNQPILSGQTTGNPDNHSMDLRTQKLNDLAKLVDFSVLQNKNGDFEIRMGSMVVLHNDQVRHIQAEEDTDNSQIRLRLDNGKTLDVTGGTIGADINVYDKVIPGYQDQLNTLAKTLVEKVNAIHETGYNLDDNTGVDFFDPNNTTAKTISLNPLLEGNPNGIAASDAAGEVGNNKIALQLFDLGSDGTMNGQSFQENAASIASSTGTTITTLTNSIETLNSAKDLLDNQQASVSAVNLDEELTNLIKYQNAYQANARVVTISQKMFDALISML